MNVKQQYYTMANICRFIGKSRSATNKVVAEFVDFSGNHENFFKPCTPVLRNKKTNPVYNIYCFMYYLENRDLIKAGAKGLKFSAELARLKEAVD